MSDFHKFLTDSKLDAISRHIHQCNKSERIKSIEDKLENIELNLDIIITKLSK